MLFTAESVLIELIVFTAFSILFDFFYIIYNWLYIDCIDYNWQFFKFLNIIHSWQYFDGDRQEEPLHGDRRCRRSDQSVGHLRVLCTGL